MLENWEKCVLLYTVESTENISVTVPTLTTFQNKFFAYICSGGATATCVSVKFGKGLGSVR